MSNYPGPLGKYNRLEEEQQPLPPPPVNQLQIQLQQTTPTACYPPNQLQQPQPTPQYQLQHQYQTGGAVGSPAVIVIAPSQQTLVTQQQAKPDNWLALAICACVFSNFILGIIAIIFSHLSDSAYRRNDMEAARSYGKITKWLSIMSIILTVIIVVICTILFFTVYSYFTT